MKMPCGETASGPMWIRTNGEYEIAPNTISGSDLAWQSIYDTE